jgi:hypothetical protein
VWRVSTILGEAGLRKPFQGPADRLAAGYRRGTALHAVLEAYAYGEQGPDAVPGLDEYVDGIRGWFDEFTPTVLFTERRVVNRRQRVTGRIDLGVLVDGEPVIVDLKRSDEQPWHAIQTVGYCDLADADEELRDVARRCGAKSWRRANLYLPGNGRYHWETRVDPRDPFLWRSAVALTQWRYEHGVLTRLDPERPDDDQQIPAGSEDAIGPSGGDERQHPR